MGRRGYLSSLGAAAALAAAGALLFVLASVWVAFHGWPGLREGDVSARSVELAIEQERGTDSRRVRLPRSRGDRTASSGRPKPGTRDHQGVKGTSLEAESLAADSPAPEQLASVGSSPLAAAPRPRPVRETVGRADDVVREVTEPVSRVTDPVLDRAAEVTDDVAKVVDGVLGP
jgi:hypothetical protein